MRACACACVEGRVYERACVRVRVYVCPRDHLNEDEIRYCTSKLSRPSIHEYRNQEGRTASLSARYLPNPERE